MEQLIFSEIAKKRSFDSFFIESGLEECFFLQVNFDGYLRKRPSKKVDNSLGWKYNNDVYLYAFGGLK